MIRFRHSPWLSPRSQLPAASAYKVRGMLLVDLRDGMDNGQLANRPRCRRAHNLEKKSWEAERWGKRPVGCLKLEDGVFDSEKKLVTCKSAASIFSLNAAPMEYEPDSARNRQNELFHAGIPTISPPVFHHPGPYRYSVTLPGFFVPFPSYTMYPNAPVEQLVPSKFRATLASMGDESLEAAFSYFQDPPLSANSNSQFDSAPRVEAPLNVTPEQQDWSYGTAACYTSPDGLQHPQAATFAHALSGTHSLYPATEQQDLYNEPATSGNNPNNFYFPSQSSTAQNPLLNSYEGDIIARMLDLEGISGGIHFLDNGSFNTNCSPTSSNTETNLSANNFYQPSNPAYGTSTTVQVLSPHPNLSPETSSTTSSTPPHDHTSPTPSPTNASSPKATRHSCTHCPRNFARLSDLKRHAMIHFPERKYHCWQLDCDRKGRGFTRRDKLRDHLRGVHELEEDELGI